VAATVTLARRARITDLRRIVLVGTETCQLRVLSRWPEGTVREVLVVAEVDLDETGRREGLVLTQGATNGNGPALAVQEGDGIVIDTGSVRVITPGDGEGVLLTWDGADHATPVSITLRNPGESFPPLRIVEEGPLRCTVVAGAGNTEEVRIEMVRGRSEIRLVSSRPLAISCHEVFSAERSRLRVEEGDGERVLESVALRHPEGWAVVATSWLDDPARGELAIEEGELVTLPPGVEHLVDLHSHGDPLRGAIRLACPIVAEVREITEHERAGDPGAVAFRMEEDAARGKLQDILLLVLGAGILVLGTILWRGARRK
jgi:hypothetical protein